MKSSVKNINLKSVDDIFSTEEIRQDQNREKVIQIPLNELYPFHDHPFKVLDDDKMLDTVVSVKSYGVLIPAIARTREKGGYEIVAGHRRHRASELAELDTMPVLVRDLDDEEATIIMVDSNLQRENILPSERAFAFKMKPYRNQAKAERKSTKADVDYIYKKKMRDNPNATTNSVSKWQQKQAIKKEYLASKGGATATQKTASATTTAVKKGTDKVVQAVGAVLKNPKVWIAMLVILLVAGVISAMASSVAMVFQGAISNVVSTSYTSEDEELVAINDNYTALESSLQIQINNIENDYPDYDEYRYDLDSIAHDPHQLASYLTARYQYFTASEMQDEIEDIFKKQYTLTLNEEIEIRYRTEIRTGTTTTTDDYGNIEFTTYEYEVEVPYEYYILNISLVNSGIYGVVNSSLSSSELEMYSVYLQTNGNKPLLFGGGSSNGNPSTDLSGVEFVNGERAGNQNIVNIALSQVGNVGGQPYWSWYGFNSRVEWCACYVSWTLNQAGYSEPKFAACENQGVPYFTENGRWASRGYADIAAGDIIFFDWNGDGKANHVGIVIGTDGSRVYTVEGNSGDACKVRDYDLNSSVIKGYGLMN